MKKVVMKKVIHIILISLLLFTGLPKSSIKAEDITILVNSGTIVNQDVSFTISAPNTHLDAKEPFIIDFGDMTIIKGCSLKFDIKFNNDDLIFWGFDYVDGRTIAQFYAPYAVDGFKITVTSHNIQNGYFKLFYGSFGIHKIGFKVRDIDIYKEFPVYHYDLSNCSLYIDDKGTLRETTYHFYIPTPIKGLFIFDTGQKVSFDSSTSRNINVKVVNSSQEGEHVVVIQPVDEKGKEDDLPRTLKYTLVHKDVFTKATISGKQGKDDYYIEYPTLTFTTLDGAYVKWGYTQALENVFTGTPVFIKESPVYFQGFNQLGSIENVQKIELKIDADEITTEVSVPEYTRSERFTVTFKVNSSNVKKYYSIDLGSRQTFYGNSMDLYLKSEGLHSITFYVETVGGRIFTETRKVIYDKTPPAVIINVPEATMNDTVSLTFESNEEVTVKEFETEGNTIKNVPANKQVTLTFVDKAGNETKKVVFVKKVMVVTMRVNSTSYTVNGEVKTMDVAPFIKDGRTFVPIRAIAEIFGATVSWDNGLITIQRGDNTISFKIGDKEASVGNKIVKFDSAPFIKDGRTFVPVRFIAEAFGFEVKWDNGLIIITETT